MKFIKVLNSEIANKLADSGFRYTIEFLNGKQIYSFSENEELWKLLNENYSHEDFFVSNMLCF